LQFENNFPTEKQIKKLEKDKIKKIGKYDNELYVYRFPKQILETKTYDFIKWIDVPKKDFKLDRKLKNSLDLDNSLLVKIKFYENYTDDELMKINKYSKFINQDDWEPDERNIYVLVSPKLSEDSIHSVEEIASFNLVTANQLNS